MTGKRKFWPVVFCTKENLAIGVSNIPLRWKFDRGVAEVRDKVNSLHWQPGQCNWRFGYVINLSHCKGGEIVLCPRCLCPVDFRAFGPSSNPPKLT